MSIWARIAYSQDLSQGMAKRLGADLSLGDPETAGPRARDLALRCAFCEEQAACAKLQARNERLESPPEYCRNKGLLQALRGT